MCVLCVDIAVNWAVLGFSPISVQLGRNYQNRLKKGGYISFQCTWGPIILELILSYPWICIALLMLKRRWWMGICGKGHMSQSKRRLLGVSLSKFPEWMRCHTPLESSSKRCSNINLGVNHFMTPIPNLAAFPRWKNSWFIFTPYFAQYSSDYKKT